MKLADHDAIPKFIETYNDTKYCYLIFEYFNGVNLYTFLEDRNFKPLRESSARRLFKQVLTALLHCHENRVSQSHFRKFHKLT